MHVLAFKELLWNTRALICFSNNLSHFMTYGLTSLVCEVFIAVHVQFVVFYAIAQTLGVWRLAVMLTDTFSWV